MDAHTLSSIIDFFKNQISLSGIRAFDIALFGSYMNGRAAPDSDIDLIVVSDEFIGKNIFERGDLLANAEKNAIHKFKIPFDVLKMTRQEYKDAIQNLRFSAQLI